jgi:fucose permease
VTETDAARPTPFIAHRRLMIAAGVAMVLFAALTAVPSVCLPRWGDAFNLSFGQRGELSSVRMAALIAALLLNGHLADRYGKRVFLIVGTAIMGLSFGVTAAATGFAALGIAQAISGVGAGSMEALVNPLVAELNPRDPGRPLNMINGLFSVGLVLASLATGELIEAGHTWQIAFWVWLPVAVVGTLLFVGKGYPTPDTPHHERAGQWREFLRMPAFWLLFLAMILGGGAEAGMTVWGPNFVEHELGATARAGAGTLSLFGAFMAIGRFSSGALLARVAPIPLMMVSAAAYAVAAAGVCFAGGLYAAWGLFALGGLFVGCFWPTLLAVASDKIAAGSSTLFALLAAAGIGGCMVLPWGIGVLGDAFGGLRVGMCILPVAMLLMVPTLAVLQRITACPPGGAE